MNVEEVGSRNGEVGKENDCGKKPWNPACLASLDPIVAVFFGGWPHETLGNELSFCLDSGVTKWRLKYLADGEEKGHTVVVFLQMFHSKSQLWCWE